MKLGANNKRNVIILSVLAVVGVYVLWANVFSSPANDDAPKAAGNHASGNAPTAVAQHAAFAASDITQGRRGRQGPSTEWNPPYKQPGVSIDPIKVDPTLRLDILSKVQNVAIDSDAQRNLFQFGAAPKAIDTTPIKSPAQIAIDRGPKGPAAPPTSTKPAEEVAPPIPLKYYGFATPRSNGNKRAFFLDNDDIIVAAEGELIKRRYKLVKIGVNSVTMEDSQFKSQQTLPLAPDATS